MCASTLAYMRDKEKDVRNLRKLIDAIEDRRVSPDTVFFKAANSIPDDRDGLVELRSHVRRMTGEPRLDTAAALRMAEARILTMRGNYNRLVVRLRGMGGDALDEDSDSDDES